MVGNPRIYRGMIIKQEIKVCSFDYEAGFYSDKNILI